VKVDLMVSVPLLRLPVWVLIRFGIQFSLE
jgi:hypothetical protein